MYKLATELLKIAELIAAVKERPTTLFEQYFFDVREQVKQLKQQKAIEGQKKLQDQILKDLSSKGKVKSVDLKLGRYRGSAFVTSCKVYMQLDDKNAKKMEMYLQKTYSPKFKFKGIEDGWAFFNIR